jgi:hypothetical protein
MPITPTTSAGTRKYPPVARAAEATATPAHACYQAIHQQGRPEISGLLVGLTSVIAGKMHQPDVEGSELTDPDHQATAARKITVAQPSVNRVSRINPMTMGSRT